MQKAPTANFGYLANRKLRLLQRGSLWAEPSLDRATRLPLPWIAFRDRRSHGAAQAFCCRFKSCSDGALFQKERCLQQALSLPSAPRKGACIHIWDAGQPKASCTERYLQQSFADSESASPSGMGEPHLRWPLGNAEKVSCSLRQGPFALRCSSPQGKTKNTVR